MWIVYLRAGGVQKYSRVPGAGSALSISGRSKIVKIERLLENSLSQICPGTNKTTRTHDGYSESVLPCMQLLRYPALS